MQLYAITIEATAQRTICLAAATLEEAAAAALQLFQLPPDTLALEVVEAAELAAAT